MTDTNCRKRRLSSSGPLELESKTQKRDDTTSTSTCTVSVLNIDHFASKRVIEIQALADVVKNVGGNHQAFQKLPHHMRRRAMSHNIKRVPKRLHEHVKSELEKVKNPNKRPSRKYRRKPANLLSEYEQRKRRIRWLDTHIWHAKRFKMMEAWGYKLPYHPTDKSIRSCYRAVQRHCLLQDVSYENYIELKGRKEFIVSGLCHLTSNEAGPTFAAKMTCNGSKEGSLYLYSYKSYPHKVIGLVTYFWHAENCKDSIGDSISTLWIGCHPSFESDVLEEIEKCFSTPSSLTASANFDGKVSVNSLKHEIVKFRLFGPASNLVLKETLKPWNRSELYRENCKQKKVSLNNECSISCPESVEQKEEMWWTSYYQSVNKQEENEKQKELFSAVLGCRSPAEAPPHLIMAATVRDPRLILPPKRNKVSVLDADTSGERLMSELITSEVSTSPLWDKDVRQNVKTTKILEKTLIDMKSKHLVPGTKLELGDRESRIPIIVIQRPGLTDCSPGTSGSSQHQIGYASGWDVLIPAGWAMAFWIAMVYRGARVGGQREAAAVALQARQLIGIRDVPDSAAGKKELQTEAIAIYTKHNKRPPAKRPNYTKLGFDSPFHFPFKRLCKEWVQQLKKITLTSADFNTAIVDDDMYVLRHRNTLKALNALLTNHKVYPKCQHSKTNKLSATSMQQSLLEKLLSTDEGRKLVDVHSSAILPVAVTVLQRGVPVSHAHICIPSREDLQKIRKTKNYGPEEELHPDDDAPKRKAERKERLKLRKKKKQGKKVKTDDSKMSSVKDSEKKKDTPEADITSLTKKVIDSCNVDIKPSRSVIGYVTAGDFDLGQGQGSGMGFCSVAGLLHLFEALGSNEGACLALVRNPTSLQYRFVSISVVL